MGRKASYQISRTVGEGRG